MPGDFVKHTTPRIGKPVALMNIHFDADPRLGRLSVQGFFHDVKQRFYNIRKRCFTDSTFAEDHDVEASLCDRIDYSGELLPATSEEFPRTDRSSRLKHLGRCDGQLG